MPPAAIFITSSKLSWVCRHVATPSPEPDKQLFLPEMQPRKTCLVSGFRPIGARVDLHPEAAARATAACPFPSPSPSFSLRLHHSLQLARSPPGGRTTPPSRVVCRQLTLWNCLSVRVYIVRDASSIRNFYLRVASRGAAPQIWLRPGRQTRTRRLRRTPPCPMPMANRRRLVSQSTALTRMLWYVL